MLEWLVRRGGLVSQQKTKGMKCVGATFLQENFLWKYGFGKFNTVALGAENIHRFWTPEYDSFDNSKLSHHTSNFFLFVQFCFDLACVF